MFMDYTSLFMIGTSYSFTGTLIVYVDGQLPNSQSKDADLTPSMERFSCTTDPVLRFETPQKIKNKQ